MKSVWKPEPNLARHLCLGMLSWRLLHPESRFAGFGRFLFCFFEPVSVFLCLLALTLVALGAQAYGETTVVAWGAGKFVSSPPDYNNYGQSIVPPNLTGAILLAGGWRHTLALNSNGTLSRWGDDTLGQTDFFPSQTNWIAISCGRLHSLALSADGTVSAAGDDGFGQTEVPANLSNVVAIACGFYHSLALRSDGKVAAWGTSANINTIGTDPSYGQAIVPDDLSNVVAIAAGGWHCLALRSDGTLRGWGRNDYGQADIPSGLSNIVAISAGAAHNLALRSDGTVVAWGLNTYGQTNVPAGLSQVTSISAGGWHNLALKLDGTVAAWGAGGQNSNVLVACGQNAVPAGLSNVVQIAAGEVHSLALVGTTPAVQRAPIARQAKTTDAFQISVPTLVGHVYLLEYKNALSDPAWNPLPLRAGIGRLTDFVDTTAAETARFYRVRKW